MFRIIGLKIMILLSAVNVAHARDFLAEIEAECKNCQQANPVSGTDKVLGALFTDAPENIEFGKTVVEMRLREMLYTMWSINSSMGVAMDEETELAKVCKQLASVENGMSCGSGQAGQALASRIREYFKSYQKISPELRASQDVPKKAMTHLQNSLKKFNSTCQKIVQERDLNKKGIELALQDLAKRDNGGRIENGYYIPAADNTSTQTVKNAQLQLHKIANSYDADAKGKVQLGVGDDQAYRLNELKEKFKKDQAVLSVFQKGQNQVPSQMQFDLKAQEVLKQTGGKWQKESVVGEFLKELNTGTPEATMAIRLLQSKHVWNKVFAGRAESINTSLDNPQTDALDQLLTKTCLEGGVSSALLNAPDAATVFNRAQIAADLNNKLLGKPVVDGKKKSANDRFQLSELQKISNDLWTLNNPLSTNGLEIEKVSVNAFMESPGSIVSAIKENPALEKERTRNMCRLKSANQKSIGAFKNSAKKAKGASMAFVALGLGAHSFLAPLLGFAGPFALPGALLFGSISYISDLNATQMQYAGAQANAGRVELEALKGNGEFGQITQVQSQVDLTKMNFETAQENWKGLALAAAIGYGPSAFVALSKSPSMVQMATKLQHVVKHDISPVYKTQKLVDYTSSN